ERVALEDALAARVLHLGPLLGRGDEEVEWRDRGPQRAYQPFDGEQQQREDGVGNGEEDGPAEERRHRAGIMARVFWARPAGVLHRARTCRGPGGSAPP